MIQHNRFYQFISLLIVITEFVLSTKWMYQENVKVNESGIDYTLKLHQYQLLNYDKGKENTLYHIFCEFNGKHALALIKLNCKESKQKQRSLSNAIMNQDKNMLQNHNIFQRSLQKEGDKQNDREKENQDKPQQVHSENPETVYMEQNFETTNEANDTQEKILDQNDGEKKNKNDNDKVQKIKQLQPGNLEKINNEKKTKNPIKPNNPGKDEDAFKQKNKIDVPKDKDVVKDEKGKGGNEELTNFSSWVTWSSLLSKSVAPIVEVTNTPTPLPINRLPSSVYPVARPNSFNYLSSNSTEQLIPTFSPSSSSDVSLIPTTSHLIPSLIPTPSSYHPASIVDHVFTKITDLPSVRTDIPSLPKSSRPTSYSNYPSIQLTHSHSRNSYSPSSPTNIPSQSKLNSLMPSQTSSEITIGLGVLLEYSPSNRTYSDTVHQDYVAVDAVMSTLGFIIDSEDFFHVISLNHRRYGKTQDQNGYHENFRNLVELGHIFELSTFQLHEKFDTIENKHYHVIEVYSVFRILNFEVVYSNEPHNEGNNLIHHEGTDDDLTTANVNYLVNKIVTRTLQDGSFLNLARERDQHIVSISEIHKIPSLKSIVAPVIENVQGLESFSALRLSGVLMLSCLIICSGILCFKGKRRYELVGYLDDLESQGDCPRKAPRFKHGSARVLNPEGMILKLKIKPDPSFDLSSMLEWQNPDKRID